MSAARDRGEDGCRTTLWYFDLMSFIDGAVVPSREDDDDDDNDENQPDNDNEVRGVTPGECELFIFEKSV